MTFFEHIKFARRASVALLMSLTAATTALAMDKEVNIYSYRQPELIEPLLQAFKDQTGIKANVQYLSNGLIERIRAEGQGSPADLILTVDIGNLSAAKAAGVTQAVHLEAINNSIPGQYRDDDGHWFGLTTRGRVVFASKDRVQQDSITYEELADPKWRGKICVRSGQHVYNVALIASMIANNGEEATKTWLEGVRDNLARKPNGNDRAQAKGIFTGECDLGIGNTYYLGLMKNNETNPEQKDWFAALKVMFPNTSDRGTHVNISGMSLAKHAPNKDAALALMTFLASGDAQEIYAEQVFEYPVKIGTSASADVKSFGKIKPDPLALTVIADYRKRASELVDEVNFDAGPQN